MVKIQGATYSQERALYAIRDTNIVQTSFEGKEDGESPLKECRDIVVDGCRFRLRYPLWHDIGLKILDSVFYDTARAALWYSSDIEAVAVKFYGIKVFRECHNLIVKDSTVDSAEACWFCHDILFRDTKVTSEYFMLRSYNIVLRGVDFTGKYSLQYIRNAYIAKCRLSTKDCLWHAKNVVIKDSLITGEYLAWYSEALTFINCTLKGTQALCYAKDVTLIDCILEDAPYSFEKSTILEASIRGKVESIKNPRSGVIYVDALGSLIMDDAEAKGKVVVRDRPSMPISN